MTNLFDVEWENISVPTGALRGRYTDCVHLTKANPNKDKSYSRIEIGSKIVDESGWVPGDRVTMMKAKGVSNMYAIRRQNSGDGKGELTLRRPSNSSKALIISSVGACLTLQYPLNGEVFDARYDKAHDFIVLTPRKQ